MQHFLWLLVAAIFLSFVIYTSGSDYDRQVKASVNVNKKNPDGSYFYAYYLDNEATQTVRGTLKDVNGEIVYSVKGSYSYRQNDGKYLTLKYISDENGFRVLSFEQKHRPVPTINPKSIASLLGG